MPSREPGSRSATIGAELALERGLEHLVSVEAPSDVRALHLEVCLLLFDRAGRSDLEPVVRGWAHEIAACERGGTLMNDPDERDAPHLWAHVQEGVLADTGTRLGESALVDAARRSATSLLEPIVHGGFDRISVTPYDVTSTVFSLDRLAAATGEERWIELAQDARAWFEGRNTAGAPVYDRARGRVADGIDEGRISENSGAEANIEAGGALLDAAARVHRSSPACSLPPDPTSPRPSREALGESCDEVRGFERDVQLGAMADPLEFDPVGLRQPIVAVAGGGGRPGQQLIVGPPHDAHRQVIRSASRLQPSTRARSIMGPTASHMAAPHIRCTISSGGM